MFVADGDIAFVDKFFAAAAFAAFSAFSSAARFMACQTRRSCLAPIKLTERNVTAVETCMKRNEMVNSDVVNKIVYEYKEH